MLAREADPGAVPPVVGLQPLIERLGAGNAVVKGLKR